MSYLVTVLRTKGSVVMPIDLDEVRAAAKLRGGWQYNEQNDALEKKENGDSCVLWYSNGQLWTKTPSEWALGEMIALAGLLHARVRGDEFETYETNDKWCVHPDDAKLKKEEETDGEVLLARLRKEQQLIRAGIIGFFILLGIIGYFIGKSFEALIRPTGRSRVTLSQ